MVVERLSKEKQIWKHYKDYLIEATGKSGSRLDHILAGIKTSVSVGCTRAELKEMMLNVFEPITIMQGLEQWQNQMDILLHTGSAKIIAYFLRKGYCKKQSDKVSCEQ